MALPPPTYIRLQLYGGRAPNYAVDLDGAIHKLTVTWNVSAQRFYFNLYDPMGVWLVTAPLIETGPGLNIQEMVYDARLRSVVVRLLEPHWRPLGQIVDWSLEGVDPDNLNGLHRCEMTGNAEFVFHVARNPIIGVNPGQMALHGTAHRYANLVKGYIETSMMIFRNGSFEVFSNARQRPQAIA